MEKFDYMAHLKKCVNEWLADNSPTYFCIEDYDTWLECCTDLYDRIADEPDYYGLSEVREEAEERICHNFDLLADALLGLDWIAPDYMYDSGLMIVQPPEGIDLKNPICLDKAILKHLLYSAIREVVGETEAMFPGKTPAQAWAIMEYIENQKEEK